MSEASPGDHRESGARVSLGNENLVVFRASRLDALLDPLLELLNQFPPDDVLAPQSIIAAQPGIKQWLPGALARRRGSSSIVANVQIQLPSAWLDACTHEYLGESAVALQDYRTERLRWRIHGLLAGLADDGVAACLDGANSNLRRYQLADRLAKEFTQYVMYRPDWLAAWQTGQPAARNAGFQPELWRRLRNQIRLPHRGELLERLIEQLQSASTDIPQDPLHVFGVNHLSPAELRLLTAMAARRPVCLYVPDPSARYWGDASATGSRQPRLVGLPASAERRETLRSGEVFEAASESLFLDEVGHPLLASWGRMGQHFMLALEASNLAMDVRHGGDEVPHPVDVAQPLLSRVQASIRELDPNLPVRASAAPADDDATLRIHSCHTRLRELEVLRDALLAARSEMPDLKPAEIAVMVPNMGAYVPLLASVFGPAGSTKVDLPYHLADVSVARTHSIFTAFTQLLSLPQSRISAPEVVDLLRIPQVAAAFGIDPGGVETLAHWLQRAGVAWGLDGEFRARQFDVPASPEFTFAWGMERMLAGYVFGQEVPGRALDMPVAAKGEPGRLWPVEGIEGPQAQLLGALDSLLLKLASLHKAATVPRAASAWSATLLEFVDGFFRIDRRDRDAREALATLRGLIGALTADTAGAGDPELPFEVVREVLLERLSAVSDRQHLLMGGITFCGMVAARSLPFRVIAVLGLNDGEFPRQANAAGLDLTVAPGNRRIGDRDVRNDDRYLFLETMMAAREQLHLSYVGEGVQDGQPRNPAAPLAELMGFLDQGTAAEGTPLKKEDPLRPWYFRHPLQPFDARYFEKDSRFFSFDAGLAATHIGTEEPVPFIAARRPSEPEGDVVVPLRSVIGWFKDPAKQVLTSALQIRLDALEEGRLAADEPLAAKLPSVERVPWRLALEALLGSPEARAIPTDPPDWLRLGGQLPAGRLGGAAWAGDKGARPQAVKMLDTVPPGLAGRPLQRAPQAVSWEGRAISVAGEIGEVLTSLDESTLWVFDAHAKPEDRLEFKQRIPLFLHWALVRLQAPDHVDVRVCLLLNERVKNPVRDWRDSLELWCAAFSNDADSRGELRIELGQRVQQLMDVYLAAQRDTVWYLPVTSWASRADGCAEAARNAWAGGERVTGEMDYSPGYAGLFARGSGLEKLPSEQVQAELKRIARMLDRIIQLDRQLSPAESIHATAEVES
ncbi:exodeoxyribonuclease V subunit gamma [Luteimonas sp. MC1572]|uniref:exodeoxyribonuclease V subunit gamma n=1 Tax=Luteimonas sp. MC1572 TaxID=2799325 RepID=UPI0018F0DD84|nr:exodeoxyribonuclease V subunit gamma [Luteimonas sp. MC1572]MBJ6981679.1 exodeoxyribonuclease V subunit gamma [Luteimonas sp. MC1572]QQO02971.1 exodeoxyribonuclease V subunit gamma [Luteimonas sp. MC1572]